MSTYVTSDLHGYSFDEFMKLIDFIKFNENDQLFILGDVIDRGKDGVKYLTWILEQPNVQLILGNHEAMLLDCEFIFKKDFEETTATSNSEGIDLLSNWESNDAQPTINALKSLLESDPDKVTAILNYLKSAPLYKEISVNGKTFTLVHGGLGNFQKNKKLSEYIPYELLWYRTPISKRYFDEKTVIFGHTPTHFYVSAYIGKMLRTDTWIDIDTGAACGGSPMLLCLDDMKEFYMNEIY